MLVCSLYIMMMITKMMMMMVVILVTERVGEDIVLSWVLCMCFPKPFVMLLTLPMPRLFSSKAQGCKDF